MFLSSTDAIRRLTGRCIGSKHFSSTTSEIYDVVVVGGGMVGMSLAAMLGTDRATEHLRIAVLDRVPATDVLLPGGLPSVPNSRVSTVTESSIKCFVTCGAWSHMYPYVREFPSMQVWDSLNDHRGSIRWEASDIGSERMGAVVENSVIQSACYRVARECPNVEFLWPCHVNDVILPPSTWTEARLTSQAGSESQPRQVGSLVSLKLSPTTPTGESQNDARTIQTRLLVAADGARSAMRGAASMRTVRIPYSQRAVVATVATDPHNVAWQRFLETGPIALLPTRDGYSNIVWSTTDVHARQLAAMTSEQFGAAVNSAFSKPPSPTPRFFTELPRSLAPRAPAAPLDTPPLVSGWRGDPPASFPLSLQHSGRYVRSRFALIGDAAHVVHPLAGQGVNLGFGDAGALSSAISYAVRGGVDVGDLRILKGRYEAPRMAVNVSMSAALHALHSIFSLRQGPVAISRSMSLSLINSSPALRSQFMRVAMGESGLPDELQGVNEMIKGLKGILPMPVAEGLRIIPSPNSSSL